MNFHKTTLIVAGIALVMVCLMTNRGEGQNPAPVGVANYPEFRVVSSDGTNLIVTNTRNATLYFYSIDPDGRIGDALKLRGKVDLSKVGEAELKPEVFFKATGAQ
ncbi:MAG: hypothetical protein SFX18_02055 [Pirellulales bacterium]|nr:hypothetical protein [Pirellulales bacterium]